MLNKINHRIIILTLKIFMINNLSVLHLLIKQDLFHNQIYYLLNKIQNKNINNNQINSNNHHLNLQKFRIRLMKIITIRNLNNIKRILIVSTQMIE